MSMKSIKVAFVAITVASLAVVACRPNTDTPTPQPGPTVHIAQSECDRAMQVPPYSVTYEDGSKASIPSGPAQFKDMIADGEISEETVCVMINRQWRDDSAHQGYKIEG